MNARNPQEFEKAAVATVAIVPMYYNAGLVLGGGPPNFNYLSIIAIYLFRRFYLDGFYLDSLYPILATFPQWLQHPNKQKNTENFLHVILAWE